MRYVHKYRLFISWIIINAFLPYIFHEWHLVTIENATYLSPIIMIVLQVLNLVFLRENWLLLVLTILLNLFGFVMVGYFSIVYAIYPLITVVLLPLV